MTSLFAPASLFQILTGEPDEQAALEATRRARIEEHEDTLHIFAHRGETQGSHGPMMGVTVGVKDIFDTFDMPTCHGSPIYADNQPPADAPIVARARMAGATIAGKTETTEFAWFSPAPTRNPHDIAHTPGGSSSGSAAGVAAGFFHVAIGSQTGGSIIRPAAFCGVAGYKPSFRLLPTVGMKPFAWSLDTAGVFARSVAECAWFASMLTARPDLQAKAAPCRIGLVRRPIDELMEPEMAAALEAFDTVDVVVPPEVEAAHAAHDVIQRFEAVWSLADEYARHRAMLSPALCDYLTEAEGVLAEEYDAARRIANRARKASAQLFANCDVLLHASAPGAAPRSLETTGDSSFNRLWTLLGVPCVNVPGMMNTAGMPLGLQVIAPFGQDALALSAASWLEKQL